MKIGVNIWGYQMTAPFIIALFIWLLMGGIKRGEIFTIVVAILVLLFCLVCIVSSIFFSQMGKIVINKEGVKITYLLIQGQEVRWNDITAFFQVEWEHPWGVIYKYQLFPKNNGNDPNKKLSPVTLERIHNYKQLLKDIIVHLPPDAKVDRKIYEHLGLVPLPLRKKIPFGWIIQRMKGEKNEIQWESPLRYQELINSGVRKT